MKTPYSSYCENGIAQGCKLCVRGEKLVLFISGKCSRSCWYCSLSNKRKEVDKIWANERECFSVKDMIQEVKASNARSAGVTGGDPLLCLPRTLKYLKALKKTFGKSFHIHIYLPTKLVNANNLKQLSRYVDEVRFHPSFLIDGNSNDMGKIKLASEYWKKSNIGIELPLLPNKKQEIINYIGKIRKNIGFLNLNEFELSETNFNLLTKRYDLDKQGYTVAGSIKAGLWILSKLKKSGLKIHLCTADLKNNYQYCNRLKLHDILPYGKKTGEGTVVYLVVEGKIAGGYYDEQKKRTIIPENVAKRLLKSKKYKIFRVEEHPTFDRYEVEKSEI